MRTLSLLVALSFLTACGPPRGSFEPQDTAETLDAADVAVAMEVDSDTVTDWRVHGGNAEEHRHSPLQKVNLDTVDRLGVAWTYDLSTTRGVEATPIVQDGVMYVTSAWSVVHALDAATGEELWVYDPDAPGETAIKACCDVVNRGVAVAGGKVYVGVIDGRLEALEAETGKLIWSTVTVDQDKPYTITGAPRIIDGKVLIGNGGAELGVRGYISAYDAQTGKLDWRFYTTPNPIKTPDNAASDDTLTTLANATWGDDGAWISDGGGGTVWDSIIHDKANDQIIFGVGNGSPWNPELRDPDGGDNLFLSSIVAVEVETGAYKWHFQTTPRDSTDYTATQTLILADLPLGEDGAARRVVMQAPKNGFFYVLDAQTGAFISGDAFVPQNWALGLDESGRPIRNPDADYTRNPAFIAPGSLGAHNWHPMAYDPHARLAYIPAQEIPALFSQDPSGTDGVKWNTGTDFSAGIPPILTPEIEAALRATLKGRLIAWDPVARQPRWSVEHQGPWNGGVLSTAGGLVFQGQLNGDFSAYDAATGDLMWQQNVKAGANAGPVTYEVDGEQYISIAAGWGTIYTLLSGYAFDEKIDPRLGQVVTFKLDGNQIIPDPDVFEIERMPMAKAFGTEAVLETGRVAYARNCMVCHGVSAISSGVLPDLRWSAITGDEAIWDMVVLDGSLSSNGMVAFDDVLSQDEAESIRAYVLAQAHAQAAADAEPIVEDGDEIPSDE
ncbi:MAG: PQQ-dependent dehydrogenase, methanol/ethanol family [Pseudomonadota bacterium]